MWAISDLENLFYHLRVIEWYADVILVDMDTILVRKNENEDWRTLSITSEMQKMTEYQEELAKKYGWY